MIPSIAFGHVYVLKGNAFKEAKSAYIGPLKEFTPFIDRLYATTQDSAFQRADKIDLFPSHVFQRDAYQWSNRAITMYQPQAERLIVFTNDDPETAKRNRRMTALNIAYYPALQGLLDWGQHQRYFGQLMNLVLNGIGRLDEKKFVPIQGHALSQPKAHLNLILETLIKPTVTASPAPENREFKKLSEWYNYLANQLLTCLEDYRPESVQLITHLKEAQTRTGQKAADAPDLHKGPGKQLSLFPDPDAEPEVTLEKPVEPVTVREEEWQDEREFPYWWR